MAHRLQVEGAEGPDIAEFQHILNRRLRRYGLYIEETGVYDRQTRTAVREFQDLRLNLKADGFVGPQTARKLRIKLVEE